MSINIYGDVHVYNDEGETHISQLEVSKAKKNVKSRDKCCVVCGEVIKQLQVHHIYPKSLYPNLSADEGNMVCLCQKHHDKYHNMYELKDCNAITFARFLKDFGGK